MKTEANDVLAQDELTNDELEVVAGGFTPVPIPFVAFTPVPIPGKDAVSFTPVPIPRVADGDLGTIPIIRSPTIR